MRNANQHTEMLIEDLKGSSEQHTDVLSEEEQVLKTCNFNADNSYVNYAGKEEQQMEYVGELNERETMLA